MKSLLFIAALSFMSSAALAELENGICIGAVKSVGTGLKLDIEKKTLNATMPQDGDELIIRGDISNGNGYALLRDNQKGLLISLSIINGQIVSFMSHDNQNEGLGRLHRLSYVASVNCNSAGHTTADDKD